MSLLGRCFFFLLLSLGLGATKVGAETTLEVVSWAPASSHGALWNDSLGGLKSSLELFNTHGGVGGQTLVLNSFNLDDSSPDFFPTLTSHLKAPGIVGVVGGAVGRKAKETAECLRQGNLMWLGPWSDEPSIYNDAADDPMAILPTWPQELAALLGYVREVYQASPGQTGPVFLVYYDQADQQEMASVARQMALEMGLELKRTPVAPRFADWAYLADYMKGAGAVIVWLTPGSSAALVKAAKAQMPQALYLTNSLNAPHASLVGISGGAWNGVVFPAVLKPSDEIPAVYTEVIRKYGPVGLGNSYQAYLGFTQGQILVRALALASGQDGSDLRGHLLAMKGFATILSAPVNYGPGGHLDPNLFYLAQGYGQGFWKAARPPEAYGVVEAGAGEGR